jgi:hypothetical protein
VAHHTRGRPVCGCHSLWQAWQALA